MKNFPNEAFRPKNVFFKTKEVVLSAENVRNKKVLNPVSIKIFYETHDLMPKESLNKITSLNKLRTFHKTAGK